MILFSRPVIMNPLLVIVFWCLANSVLGSISSAVCNNTNNGSLCTGIQITTGVLSIVALVACIVALAMGGGGKAVA